MNARGKAEAWLEDIWWRPVPPPLFLGWMGPVYGIFRAASQQARICRASTPPLPLISVGNITVGGSGKTPFVIWLAQALQSRGFRPVLLCRGDGGSLKKPRILQAEDEVLITGDEARLLMESCHCPVIAGKDRVQGAGLAAELGDILILDDGFQYRQLKRQCDVVLVPAEGIGNGCQLPAGPLREQVASLARANVIVRTGEQAATPLTQGKEWQWGARKAEPRQLLGTKQGTPSRLLAVSAIARSWRFLDSLQKNGVQVEGHIRFPDHHLFSDHDIRYCLKRGLPIIVTSKDAVKLLPLWPADQPLWVLEQIFAGDEGLLDAILLPILSQNE